MRELAEEGLMPNFAEMIEDGRLGTMKTTIPSNTSPAAYCLYTGCNPAKNGPVAMRKRDDDTPYNRQDLETKAIWDYLDEFDKDFFVHGARFSEPVPDKGEAFTGWYPKSSYSEKDYYPDSIEKKLEEFDKPKDDWTDEDVEQISQMDAAAVSAFDSEDRDFRLVYIGFPDTVGHNHWGTSRLQEAYSQVDRLLGEVLDLSDETVVVSDHGFYGAPDYYFHVNSLLEDAGLIERSGGSKLQDVLVPWVKRNVPDSLIRPIWMRIKDRGGEQQDNQGEILDSSEGFLSFEKRMPGVKWDETRAYSPIYFGVDTKDDDATKKVIELLEEVEHNGEKVVEEVYRKEELYEGPHLDRLPEVLFVLDNNYKATHTFSSKLFTDRGLPEKKGRHGYARDAVFGVSKGLEMPGNEVRIYDIVPTVLALLGIDVESRVDGRILDLAEFSDLKETEEMGDLEI